MDPGPKVVYEFGPFRVDPHNQLLLRDNQPVSISRKVFDTLLILVRHSGDVVTKDDLMKELWPTAFVEEANLSQTIFMLRKALGETPDNRRYIVTLSGRGYRFAAEVRAVSLDSDYIMIASHTRSQVVVESADSEATPSVKTLPAGWGSRTSWRYLLPVVACFALLVLCAGILARWRRPVVLGEKHSVLVAEFANSTGDPIFDGSLRLGLTIQLEQSPFLSIVSDQRVQQTLRMMGQPAEAKLTPAIARELCQRSAGAAVLDGSIAQIGTQYLLTLKAVDCESGESLASTEAQAIDKNHVLDALGKTSSEMRKRLGESLSTVHKFDTPLERATTPSLEALKAVSSGRKVQSVAGAAAAIPFFKSAIELDPRFATAYAWLSVLYTDIGEPRIAADYARKAYELRDRTSEAEKYFISARFYKAVTGNMEKAEQICQLWIQAYPRADAPHDLLSGSIHPALGQYEKGVDEGREAIRLNPDLFMSYALVMFNYIALNRPDQAKSTYQHALERKLHNPFFYLPLYQIAFLRDDAAAMAQQVTQSAATPGAADELLVAEADTAAYYGRLRIAREASQRAMEFADGAQQKESAATYFALSGLREALFGNAKEAQRLATLALARSTGRDVEYGSALALVYAGDDARAHALTDDLAKRFPEDTLVQFNYLPTLGAKLAVSKENASEAIESLRAATQYELGQTTSSSYGWTALYPVFVRGEAYLDAHQCSKAAAEFQKIIDHRGIVLNEPIGALAHLGLGRAHALSGDKAEAKAAYQDFLTLWKDADPEIPILKQAEAEYTKLLPLMDPATRPSGQAGSSLRK